MLGAVSGRWARRKGQPQERDSRRRGADGGGGFSRRGGIIFSHICLGLVVYCKRHPRNGSNVLGKHRKSLERRFRGLQKSSQMRPRRLQNHVQDLWETFGLLAAPGPLPGRSWGSPELLLAPPGPLLVSLGPLWRPFWELFALLLEARTENSEHLVFDDRTTLFLQANNFMVPGSPNHYKIVPKSLRGASWAPGWPLEGAKSGLVGPWDARHAI